MDYLENINLQWEELEGIVKSAMVRSFRSSNRLDTDLIDSVFDAEIAKWNTPGNYRGKWLSEIRKNDPKLADRLAVLFGQYRLLHEFPFKKEPVILYVLVSLFVTLLFFLFISAMEFPLWKEGLLYIASGVVVLSTAGSIYAKRKSEKLRQLCDYYHNQLSVQKKQLEETIVRYKP